MHSAPFWHWEVALQDFPRGIKEPEAVEEEAAVLRVEDAWLARYAEEARKPLQRPLLQVLVAHWESEVQAELNLPQDLICQAVEAKQSAPFAHCSVEAHSAPRGRDPAAATTVEDGAG